MSTKETKQAKGSGKSSSSNSYTKVYHQTPKPGGAKHDRYKVKKPPLHEHLEDTPSDWYQMALFVEKNVDYIYTIRALLTSIFVDTETNKGVLYLRLPFAAEDYEEEYKDAKWMELLKFECMAVDRDKAVIGLPWNSYHNVMNLKVSTAGKMNAMQVFAGLKNAEGWLSDVEIVLSFKLTTYTDFPSEGKHGISCKLQAPPFLLQEPPALVYDEAAQDPEHPYFTG